MWNCTSIWRFKGKFSHLRSRVGGFKEPGGSSKEPGGSGKEPGGSGKEPGAHFFFQLQKSAY